LTTRQEVRASLTKQGYRDAFSSPGRPELWIGPKGDRKATARNKTTGEWSVVPYPEPSCCTPSESSALEERDGIVLQCGRVNEFGWLE
jgi:hypothetical protein